MSSPELKIYEEKMNKTVSVMTSEFASIRAGRANPAVLDKVLVDYYGTPTKIREMASVSVSEARVLVIQPYDKSSLKNIERAIQTSDIGINPANDGTVLRLPRSAARRSSSRSPGWRRNPRWPSAPSAGTPTTASRP